MQTSTLVTCMLSSWVMAAAYDKIEMVTGMELNVLLYAAVVTMVAGLYFGLYAENKNVKEEETR